MKNIFLLSFLMFTVSLSQLELANALAANETTQNRISNIDFSGRVTLRFNDNRAVDIKKCQEVPYSSEIEKLKYDVMGPVLRCAMILPAKMNHFYFFKKNGNTYFRHVKTFASRTYEVKYISPNEIELGELVESWHVSPSPDKNFSSI